MSKKFDQRLLDANAMVMGGGVGLAALESMFNLVQTQSLLSASMVRDHDLSYGLSLEALALSMGEVLDPGVYSGCRQGRCSNKVRVDIPSTPPPAPPAPAPDAGNQSGALSNADALRKMAQEIKDASTSTTTTTTQTSELDDFSQKLLLEIFELLGGHLTNLTQHMDHVTEASRNNLMVT